MRNKYTLSTLTILQLLFSGFSFSQNSLDSVLANVLRNNKSIIANHQLLESKKTAYKTGIYLKSPTVAYDYMKGSPVGAGNQSDITVVQSFDFPTSYAKRKQLSNASTEKLVTMEKGFRQGILLETKLIYLQLVYLNKHLSQLTKRTENAAESLKAIHEKFEKGAASILDVNKAKINLLSIQNKLRLLQSEKAELAQQLAALNGGETLLISATRYPLNETLPSLETLFSEAVLGDYRLQSIQQEQLISKKKEQLNRALALPKLEGGYRYQSILGQTFNGFHAGISIPLFENKNKVQAAQQQEMYFTLLEGSHKNKHHNELEALYNKTLSLQQGMNDYNLLLNTMNSKALLSKALELGEISTIEYFLELRYYYTMYDEYLSIEKEYHLNIASLLKYKLAIY